MKSPLVSGIPQSFWSSINLSITWINDFKPVVLMPVGTISFEILVLMYLKDITGPWLVVEWANRSGNDAVNMGLHYTP